MLNTIIISLWLTMLLGLMLESMRTKVSYSQVRQVNRQLENRLMAMTTGVSNLSVFHVRDFRNALMEEFVKQKVVDELEMYLVDPHHLHLKYRKEKAQQEFEVHVDRDRFAMEEVFDENNDFDEYRV